MDHDEKLEVKVAGDLAEMIRSQVESGAFDSADEVVDEALRALRERIGNRERRLVNIVESLDKAMANPVRYTAREVHLQLEELHETTLRNRAVVA